MKCFITFFLFYTYSLLVSAQTCKNYETEIVFVNGVNTVERGPGETARGHTRVISEIYQIPKNAELINETGDAIKTSYSYNRTEGWTDFLEAGRQALDLLTARATYYKKFAAYAFLGKDIGDKKVMDFIQKKKFEQALTEPRAQDVSKLANIIINKQRDKKRVIVVSHSQGNLITNEAYRLLENHDEFKPKLYGNLQIATPASSLLGNGRYITNSLDMIDWVPFNLSPNTIIEKRDNTPDSLYHSFQKIYLSQSILGKKVDISPSFIPMREIFVKTSGQVASGMDKLNFNPDIQYNVNVQSGSYGVYELTPYDDRIIDVRVYYRKAQSVSETDFAEATTNSFPLSFDNGILVVAPSDPPQAYEVRVESFADDNTCMFQSFNAANACDTGAGGYQWHHPTATCVHCPTGILRGDGTCDWPLPEVSVERLSVELPEGHNVCDREHYGYIGQTYCTFFSSCTGGQIVSPNSGYFGMGGSHYHCKEKLDESTGLNTYYITSGPGYTWGVICKNPEGEHAIESVYCP